MRQSIEQHGDQTPRRPIQLLPNIEGDEDELSDDQVQAAHGEKMIEVKIRLWTNDIAEGKGNFLPKHAWSAGVVRMEGNKSHGIVPGAPLPFHSMLDVGRAIEKCLIDQGIILHPSRRVQKYSV